MRAVTIVLTVVAAVAFACPVWAGEVAWDKDFKTALKKAKEYYEKSEEAQLIIVFFWQPDDENSKSMKDKTFKDADVVDVSSDHRWVSVNGKEDYALFKKCGLSGTPALVFFNHDGLKYGGREGMFYGSRKMQAFIDKFDSINVDYYETKKALDEKPDDLSLLLKMGKIWLDCVQPKKAKEYFNKVIAKAGAADVAVKTKATYYLARAEAQSKDSDKAAELFKKAQKLDPSNKSGIRDLIDYQLANIAWKGGLYGEALKKLGAFVKKYPNSAKAPQAIVRMADCYTRRNNPDMANKMYEKVAKDYPESREGRQALAWLAQQKKKKK
jgi:TolA-binding protein